MRARFVFCLNVAAPALLAIVALSGDSLSLRALAADGPKSGVANGKAERAEGPVRQGPARQGTAGPDARATEKFAALLLWCGIIVVGLLLLTGIVVWGRWLRRVARRKPLPPTAPDPLWYLKPKPPLPSAPAGTTPGDLSPHSTDENPGSDSSNRSPL
jgi:hypothetical protein